MTSTAAPVKKTQSELDSEWDILAPIRHRQIVSNQDRTYHDVLVPSIMTLSGTFLTGAFVLDVGCGTGDLAARLTKLAAHVVGVDPSRGSIEIARSLQNDRSPEFHTNTIQEFSKNEGRRFDVAIANMSLMDCLDLNDALAAIALLLKPEALFVCTITHPWNWPLYWGYHDAPWFNYKAEMTIESTFRISSEQTNCVATHIHRPLEAYITSLNAHGFLVEKLLEPLPPEVPLAEQWQYPRYLAVRAVQKKTWNKS